MNELPNMNFEATRRKLIAKRVAAGANTPIGHRCSNLVELLDNYATAESEDQREKLGASIRRQMSELAYVNSLAPNAAAGG